MWRIVGSHRAGFTTSTAGTSYLPPAQPAEAGDVDVLFVQAETTIATPPGWTLPSGGSRVGNMGAYAFIRTAQAGDIVGATLVAPLNGFQGAVSWVRVRGAASLDIAVSVFSDSAGQAVGPAQTGLLPQRHDLLLAAALLQTGGTGSGAPTNAVWNSLFVPVNGASGSVGAMGPSQMSAFVAASFYTGAGSQQATVSWTGPMGSRYLLLLAFKAANPPQTLYTTQVPTSLNVNDPSRNTLGEVMRAGVPGRIIGVTWMCPSTLPAAGVRAGVCSISSDTSGAVKVTRDFTALHPGDWSSVLFYDPLGVGPDQSYQVAAGELFVPVVSTPDRYVATNNFHTAEITNGDLTALADGQPYRNGRFHAGGTDVAFPESSFAASTYFVDVLFVPDQPAGPGVATAAAALTSATAAVKQHSAAGGSHAGITTTAAAGKRVTTGGSTYLALFSSGVVSELPSVVRGAFTTLGLFSVASAAKVTASRSATASAADSGMLSVGSVGKVVTVTAGTLAGFISRLTIRPDGPAPLAGPARVQVTSTQPVVRVSGPPRPAVRVSNPRPVVRVTSPQ